jgi:hypothetical protein
VTEGGLAINYQLSTISSLELLVHYLDDDEQFEQRKTATAPTLSRRGKCSAAALRVDRWQRRA